MKNALKWILTTGFLALATLSCTHQEVAKTEPASDRSPATSSKPKGHWITGLRNDNVTEFGLQGKKIIALTFDDGPGDGTAKVMALLEKYKIEATFFSIGENAKEHPDLLKQERTIRDGGLQNIVGNHSYTHPDLASGEYTNRPEALYLQLIRTDRAIKGILGEEDFFSQSKGVLFFRAPFGSWQKQDAQILRKKIKQYDDYAADLKHYYGPIYWDVGGEIACDHPVANAPNSKVKCDGQTYTDAADWDCWDNNISVDKCAEGYLNKFMSTQGGVVLSHDIYTNTADMWEILLPKLIKEGFTFVRLDKVPNISRVKLPKALQ